VRWKMQPGLRLSRRSGGNKMINFLDDVKHGRIQAVEITAGLKLWDEYFSKVRGGSQDFWNDEAKHLQRRFELGCGGRWTGQEVMAFTAYAYLYDTGDGLSEVQKDLGNWKTAMSKASLSVEVKGHIRSATRMYED